MLVRLWAVGTHHRVVAYVHSVYAVCAQCVGSKYTACTCHVRGVYVYVRGVYVLRTWRVLCTYACNHQLDCYSSNFHYYFYHFSRGDFP